MLSFDVVSLFTKVPIDQAINILRSRLQEDNKLDERTIFSPNDLCDLVELCVKSTYFCYHEQFYEQIEGASMGSPLSPIFWQIYPWRILKTMQSVPPPLNHLSGTGTLMTFSLYGLIHNNTSYILSPT